MNAQTSLENKTKHLPKGLLGGAILITLGVLSLVGQFVQAEWYGQFILTALAALFLVSGVALRNIGLLIPGGILGGLSLGVWVQGYYTDVTDERQGAIFLLCFALGWAVITGLSLLTTRKFVWWPLIPGGIMALIGGSLLAGGAALEALKWFGIYGWPLILIAIGVLIIVRRK